MALNRSDWKHTKERPIIFSAESVRAILAWKKTQTRRVVKPQPDDMTTGVLHLTDGFRFVTERTFRKFQYEPGTRLWVRESFSFYERRLGCWYWADGSESPYDCTSPPKPSIFMPRWASRIRLEITDVRVQRLQEISEEDAQAEGYQDIPNPPWKTSSIVLFRSGWNSLNAKRGLPWDSNPWVWALTFKNLADRTDDSL